MASSTTTPRKGFGKRNLGQQTTQPQVQRRRNNTAASTSDEGTEIHYNARLSHAGVLILAPIIDGTLGFSNSLAGAGIMGGPPAAWEQLLFSFVPYMIGALGLFWLVQGLRGGIALKVTQEGVNATTFYGPVSYKWDGIGRISVLRKPNGFGTQFISLFGAQTETLSTTLTVYPEMTISSWFRTPIEVRVCNTDSSLEEILETIARYRPELVENISS